MDSETALLLPRSGSYFAGNMGCPALKVAWPATPTRHPPPATSKEQCPCDCPPPISGSQRTTLPPVCTTDTGAGVPLSVVPESSDSHSTARGVLREAARLLPNPAPAAPAYGRPPRSRRLSDVRGGRSLLFFADHPLLTRWPRCDDARRRAAAVLGQRPARRLDRLARLAA